MMFGLVNKIFYFSHEVEWHETTDAYFPYESIVNGKLWRLRLNDFPDEQLFTLFINDKKKFDFDDHPVNWKGIGSDGKTGQDQTY